MAEKSEFQGKLEFWIWITKGARFTANERCLKQNKWSNFAIGMLSAYILIVNLISVFQISNCTYFNGNHVAFYTTALSILILVFSQLENSNDFKLKALNYHNCALELSRVYREVRSLDLTNLDGEQYIRVLNNKNQNTKLCWKSMIITKKLITIITDQHTQLTSI